MGVAGAVWLFPVVMSAYAEWSGGATFGPRYLVLAVPLWVLAVGSLRQSRGVGVWVLAATIPSAVVSLMGRTTPPFAIDDVAGASTLRGWALPALSHGLWNRPFGVVDQSAAAWCLAVVACIWVVAGVVAFGRRWRETPLRARLVAAGLVAALFALQLGSGRVTQRQREWLRWVAPSFRNLK